MKICKHALVARFVDCYYWLQRAKLATRTPITLEVFMAWKEKKKKEKEEAAKVAAEKREADIKSGKAMRSGTYIYF